MASTSCCTSAAKSVLPSASEMPCSSWIVFRYQPWTTIWTAEPQLIGVDASLDTELVGPVVAPDRVRSSTEPPREDIVSPGSRANIVSAMAAVRLHPALRVRAVSLAHRVGREGAAVVVGVG